MKISRVSPLAVLCAALLAGACDDDPSRPDPVVSVAPADTTVVEGSAYTLRVAVANAGPGVTYATSAAAVATVSGAGQVTALAPGTATFTVTSTEDPSAGATARVTVTAAAVASVTLGADTASAPVGGTRQLAATVRDAGGRVLARTVAWASLDAAVATVSGTGVVTGVAPGVARVTATAEGKADTVRVVVYRLGQTTVIVTPPGATLNALGRQVQLAVDVRGPDGAVIPSSQAIWQSLDPQVAVVTAGGGMVTAVGPGVARVRASFGETASDTSLVTVQQVPASVTLSPNTPITLQPGQTRQIEAVARDSGGAAIQGAALAWTTSNAAAATVSGTGLVTAVANGSALITAAAGGVSAQVQVTVAGPIAFARIFANGDNSCGLTADGRAFCWGGNPNGSLGDAAGARRLPARSPAGPDIRFSTLSVGYNHTCGIATTGQAYCWGHNQFGQLGNGIGTEVAQPTPQLVAGGIAFDSISAGFRYTCAVSAATRRAYCWGENVYGQLGNGTQGNANAPVPVSGDLSFRSIRAGRHHTCGVTTAGEAYCWGWNVSGQLGTGPATVGATQTTPAAVSGGLTFRVAIPNVRYATDGGQHTCGLTTAGALYCWGDTLPIGGPLVTSPTQVAPGTTFASLDMGGAHGCAVATGGTAYCFGQNFHGQLGDGTQSYHGYGVPVAGGTAFTSVDAGERHTCGLDAQGFAYCWGYNTVGQLGTNDSVEYRVPTAVGPVQGGASASRAPRPSAAARSSAAGRPVF